MRFTSPAAALMLMASAALGAGAVLGIWVIVWLLGLTLVGFLVGPGSQPAPDVLPEPLLLAPPFAAAAGTLLVMWWLRARGILSVPGEAKAGEDEAPLVNWASPRPSSLWTVALLAIGSLGYLAYARLVFQYHRIDGGIDNGVYLYAARLVMEGQVPYRDFHHNQTALLLYFVGPALAPFGYDEGAARVFGIACTLAAMLVTFLAAERLGGRLAGLLAFGFLLTSLDFITELSAGTRTNGAVTALLAALTALALAGNRPGLALAFSAVAAGVRLTFAPVPVVIASYWAFARGRPGRALGLGLALAAIVFGPFLLLGGEGAVFGMLSQTQRVEFMERWFGLPKGLRYQLLAVRNGFLDIVQPYLPLWLSTIPALYVIWRRLHPRFDVLAVLAISSLMVLLANVTPYPGSPRYPVTQLPLLAVLGGVALATLVHRLATHPAGRGAAMALLGGACLLLAAAPLGASRPPSFVEWYQHQPPVERLRQMADYVRGLGAPDATLLTLDMPIASQSGLRLLRGLEQGNWTIVRGMSEERARRLKVLTYDMLIEMVERQEADIAVESDIYGFARNFARNDAQRERMRAALTNGYVLRRTFDEFADWGQVRVYTRRTD